MCQRTKAMGCGFLPTQGGGSLHLYDATVAWHSHGPDCSRFLAAERRARALAGQLRNAGLFRVHACGCHRLASLGPPMEASLPFAPRPKLLSMLTHSLAQRGPRRMGVQGPGLATGRVRLCSQQSFLDDSFEGPSQRLILSDAYIWKQAQTWSGRRFGQPKGPGQRVQGPSTRCCHTKLSWSKGGVVVGAARATTPEIYLAFLLKNHGGVKYSSRRALDGWP